MYASALRELSEPRPGGDLVKCAIQRAARNAGLTYWRAFDIWYRKARRIEAGEAEQIHGALRRKREDEARNEIADLRIRLIAMESRLAAHICGANADTLRFEMPRGGGSNPSAGRKGR